MFPMQRKVLQEPVTVEYDCRGKRVQRVLPTSYAARSFFQRMFKAGRNPAIINTQHTKEPNDESQR